MMYYETHESGDTAANDFLRQHDTTGQQNKNEDVLDNTQVVRLDPELESVEFHKVTHSFNLDTLSIHVKPKTLGDIPADPDQAPESAAIRSVLSVDMQRTMEEFLTPTQKEVLTLVYGLDGNATRTYAEIAAQLAISDTRIGQICRTGIINLRNRDKMRDYKGHRNKLAQYHTDLL